MKAIEHGQDSAHSTLVLPFLTEGVDHVARFTADSGCSSAISACEKAGEWQAALHLLASMEDFHAKLPPFLVCNLRIWLAQGGDQVE